MVASTEKEASARAELPPGIRKEVISPAPTEELEFPKKGDECTVHYVGRFYNNDREFDSTRNRGSPLTFKLGVNQVIQGWDLSVATMRRGEVSSFICAPEYCYGEKGAPPKIPGDATLIFEIELLDWRHDDDLFNDGGAIRTKLEEGTGFEEPGDRAEVLLSLKATAADGRVLDDRPCLEYVIGSGSLGTVSRVVDRSLADMKKGGSVSLACSKDYAYGDASHGNVTVQITLCEIYRKDDVSREKNGSTMKKMIREGEDYAKPKDGGTVHLTVAAVTDAAGTALPTFQGPKELRFVAGDGEVCDALEYAVPHMLKGERAIVICASVASCADPKLGLEELQAAGMGSATICLTVELHEFHNGKQGWEMSDEEKFAYAAARKEVGGKLFKAQRYGLALERYRLAAEFLSQYARVPEGGEEFIMVCELNKAACMLKVGDHFGAKAACTKVLRENPENVKALFRRASAYYELHEFSEAVADLRALVQLDPENREAQRLLQHAVRGARQEEKRGNSMFAKMNKAFSGLAEQEVQRDKEKKEAREAEIARKGAEARAEAQKKRETRQLSAEEAKEDIMRASQEIANMRKKCFEMEMNKYGGREDDD